MFCTATMPSRSCTKTPEDPQPSQDDVYVVLPMLPLEPKSAQNYMGEARPETSHINKEQHSQFRARFSLDSTFSPALEPKNAKLSGEIVPPRTEILNFQKELCFRELKALFFSQAISAFKSPNSHIFPGACACKSSKHYIFQETRASRACRAHPLPLGWRQFFTSSPPPCICMMQHETGAICQIVVFTRKRCLFWAPRGPHSSIRRYENSECPFGDSFSFWGSLQETQAKTLPNAVFCGIWTPTSDRHAKCQKLATA